MRLRHAGDVIHGWVGTMEEREDRAEGRMEEKETKGRGKTKEQEEGRRRTTQKKN